MKFDYCPSCTQHPQPLTRELFESLIRQPWLKQLADEIAGGKLDRKRDLPAACWQAAFGGEKRSNQHALPSGLFALDIDHIDDPEALYRSFAPRIEELGIYICHMTPSTRGLRIVARCQPEFDTISAQQAWLAGQLHVVHDAVTRDMARLSFLVPESYFYYYNANIFTDEAPVILTNPALERHAGAPCDQSSAPALLEQGVTPSPQPEAQGDPHEETQPEPPAYRGVPYADIVRELVTRTGGEPVEGERNNRLYLICRLLCNITDRQPERLFEVCPRFGLSDAEVKACCESACKSARTERLPFLLYKVLHHFGIDPNGQANACLTDSQEEDETDLMPYRFPPSDHLPPLIREFVETAPDDFKEATALSCLPICGFLGSRLRARYADGELQAPSFIVNVIAPAASGKGSLLRIADLCLAKVRAADDEGREQEAEYQRQSRLKKNEKKQLEEPTPIVRDIPAKVSVAQLLKRMKQAQGLHLISVSPEADTLTTSNKAGAWSQKSDIYRIAQDGEGGRYGQDYKSDVSFSATCQMRYNLLTLGTPGAFARAYPDVEDGLITRCIMAELPSQFGKAMPVRLALSPRQERIIQTKVDALMAICQDEEGRVLPEHHLSLPWLIEGMERWLSEQRLRAVRDEDHARDQFMRRAALIGFRTGMVATFLWGEKLSKMRKDYVVEFALWVASYVLQSLLKRYADKVNEQSLYLNAPKARRYPSLFDALPDIFSKEELRRVSIAQGMRSPTKAILFRWSENGLIEKQGEHYVKLIK